MRATMIEGPKKDWQRVAAAVVERRLELDMTQEELAQAAGLSPTTVRLLEAGTRSGYRALTLARLATALEWPSTKFVELLAGADESGAAPRLDDGGDDDLRERISDLEAGLQELTVKVDALYRTIVDRIVPPEAPPRQRRKPRQSSG